MMKRVIWHWTAGGHTPNSTDLGAYHEVIDGKGNVVKGNHLIEDNKAPIRGRYAAHTRNFNSDSIGLSVAAMRGAVERPFNAGPSPLTKTQVRALVERTAALCKLYNIPVSRETTLSHAEVAITHKVAQPGKWDITWLPGMSKPVSSVEVGDILRKRILDYMEAPHPQPAPKGKSLWDLILMFFGRK